MIKSEANKAHVRASKSPNIAKAFALSITSGIG
jgi:hypothetical protein